MLTFYQYGQSQVFIESALVRHSIAPTFPRLKALVDVIKVCSAVQSGTPFLLIVVAMDWVGMSKIDKKKKFKS